MKLTEIFCADLEREVAGTRRALERVPDGRTDWKPHERSMPLGYLATLVARIPSWIAMIVEQDSIDIASIDEERLTRDVIGTNAGLVEALEQSVAAARASLERTTDEHLMTTWQFKVDGKVVNEQPRHEAIRDAVLNHLVHHRGQLTVYLRLVESSVPVIYGPSADEGRLA
jgi:uncharacterized damage-inducible protein DinB